MIKIHGPRNHWLIKTAQFFHISTCFWDSWKKCNIIIKTKGGEFSIQI